MQQRVDWLKNGVVAGVVFGLFFGAMQGLKRGSAAAGVTSGLVAGGIFGVTMALFGRWKSRELAAPAVDDNGETVLLQGPANHWKGAEAVGGHLCLTRARLRFKSHGFNVQVHEASYPLGSIQSVEPARSLGIIPNGLLVVLDDGRREKFVVNRRGEWVEKVRAAVNEKAGPRST